jgi:hypothetical protein
MINISRGGIFMLGNLYYKGQLFAQVNILDYSVPFRQKHVVNTLGGQFVQTGRKEPGKVLFEIAARVNIPNHSMNIELSNENYKFDAEHISSNTMTGITTVRGDIY